MDKVLLTIILILAYAILASIKVSFQSHFAKKHAQNFFDIVLFWVGVFFVIVVTFLPVAIANGQMSPDIIWYTILSAISTVGFQFAYSYAMKTGPVGLTVFLNSFNVVIIVGYSAIVFKDIPTLLQWIGLAILMVSFLFNFKKDKEKKPINIKWVISVIVALVCSAADSILIKHFSNNTNRYGYMVYQYAFSFGFCLVISLFLLLKNNKPAISMIKAPYIIHVLGCGLILAACVAINHYSIAIAASGFLFPFRSGACMILGIITSIILYKEKLKWNQYVAVGLGVAAIILVNWK